jgi:hypothetical protein
LFWWLKTTAMQFLEETSWERRCRLIFNGQTTGTFYSTSFASESKWKEFAKVFARGRYHGALVILLSSQFIVILRRVHCVLPLSI